MTNHAVFTENRLDVIVEVDLLFVVTLHETGNCDEQPEDGENREQASWREVVAGHVRLRWVSVIVGGRSFVHDHWLYRASSAGAITACESVACALAVTLRWPYPV